MIQDGIKVWSEDGCLGDGSGSTGVASVTGTGSNWTYTSSFYVGYYGLATLTISNGGSLNGITNGIIAIGYQPGSTGTVTVSGANSTWTGPMPISVGSYGNGTFSINDGRHDHQRRRLDWGQFRLDGRSCRRDGVGSTWTSDNYFRVGSSGGGTLAITNGGSVSITTFVNPTSIGPTGMATVDGGGSTWALKSDLYVDGVLSITKGGVVSNKSGYLGYYSGSSGTITADGAGSTWTNNSWSLCRQRRNRNTEHHGRWGSDGDGRLDRQRIVAGDRHWPREFAHCGRRERSHQQRRHSAVAGGGRRGGGQHLFAHRGWNLDRQRGVSGAGRDVDATSHQFTVSPVTSGTAATPVTIDQSQEQRILITDPTSGNSVAQLLGDHQPHNAQPDRRAACRNRPELARRHVGPPRLGLGRLDVRRHRLHGGRSGLSLAGHRRGYSRNNLDVCRYNGSGWTMYPASDLTVNGASASFTVSTLDGYGYAVTTATVVPGDVNGDGQVDINDLTIVLANFGQTTGMTWSTGDLNGDGRVDFNDLTILLTAYGQMAARRPASA